jgi:hypothetical protein
VIPLERWPGFSQWGRQLDALMARPDPLWIFGPRGSGTTTLARFVAESRHRPQLEAVDAITAPESDSVIAAHAPCPWPASVLELRLPALEDVPECIPGILAWFAQEEGIEGHLPETLGRLPCPGNLRELRNRVVRYKLTGQLPDIDPTGPPDFAEEDLASNLHRLEAYLLHRALRRSYGNRVEAAKRLGVSRPQLYALIRRHGDPVRGEPPVEAGPKRLLKRRTQNTSP